MTAMRYEWTPASEPPDTNRWVLAWHKGSTIFDEGMRVNLYSHGRWLHVGWSVTHWRDIAPPKEMEGTVSEVTTDDLIDLAGALEVRRILEEIKKVAGMFPLDDMPTPFQAAWQQCCEELFFRATGEQWHLDEDAERFARAANDSAFKLSANAVEPPREGK